MDGHVIKSYSEIGQAAMKAGEGNIYRLWLLARSMDTTGRGCIPLSALRSYTNSLITYQTLMRTIKAGRGTWWHTEWRGMLKLRSLKAVAGRLGADMYAHPVYLPFACFGRLGDFYTACMASMMAGKPRTIAQRTLAALYGRSLRSINGYVQKSKRTGLLTVQPQAVLTNLASDDGTLQEDVEKGYFVTWVHGVRYTARHLPNQYTADNLGTAPFGQVKTIGKACSTTRGRPKRLYFEPQSKSLHRALLGLAEGGDPLYVSNAAKGNDGIQYLNAYENRSGKVCLL